MTSAERTTYTRATRAALACAYLAILSFILVSEIDRKPRVPFIVEDFHPFFVALAPLALVPAWKAAKRFRAANVDERARLVSITALTLLAAMICAAAAVGYLLMPDPPPITAWP